MHPPVLGHRWACYSGDGGARWNMPFARIPSRCRNATHLAPSPACQTRWYSTIPSALDWSFGLQARFALTASTVYSALLDDIYVAVGSSGALGSHSCLHPSARLGHCGSVRRLSASWACHPAFPVSCCWTNARSYATCYLHCIPAACPSSTRIGLTVLLPLPGTLPAAM